MGGRYGPTDCGWRDIRSGRADTGPTHPRATNPLGLHIGIIDIISTTSIKRLRSDDPDYPDPFDEDHELGCDDRLAADRRWRPVAAIAGGVLVLAMIATAVIVNGGDSASTTATVLPPTPRTVIATPRPTIPLSPPSTSLPPETVTTLPPRSSQPGTIPTPEPSTPAPPENSLSTPAPAPAVDPRTVVYRVTGTKQFFDLVTVVYTDEQGVPHTDLNVSLPWTKSVVLNPGVQLKSVVATSLASRLNCTITDAAGQTIVASTNNAIIATCTR